MPMRPVLITAGGTDTAIAGGERLRPVQRIQSLTPALFGSAGLFLAANGFRAVLSLTKFRQINQHDPQ
jgi:hypothetical protein